MTLRDLVICVIAVGIIGIFCLLLSLIVSSL
jgi:hypothetical protein